MADFVAVLKKTLDGLKDPTPELRQKVYAKARATIAAKLAAISPPPPQAVADRQKRALEDAIATVEAQYPDRAGPRITPDPLAELDQVFASIERQKNGAAGEPSADTPEPEPEEPIAVSDEKAAAPVVAGPEPAAGDETPPTRAPEPATEPEPVAATPPAPAAESWPKSTPVIAPPAPKPASAEELFSARNHGPEHEREFEAGHAAGHEPETGSDPFAAADAERADSYRRRRGYGLIAALVAIAAIVAGGYAIWLNKDALFGPGSPQPVVAAPEAEQPAETAAVPPAGEAAPEAPAASEPAIEKFTQRLTPEGTEVDAGPAGGSVELGEGTSLAAVTQPPATAPQAQPQQTPPASGPSVAVGQRAIFYEERTNVAQGSAEPGSIVWSVVQESPGGDLPPEPAIRAEATIPGKDVQLRMTIRRNGDQTLPASHIIEVIFLTPEGFEGGGIENILRISMKGSEQEAGSPLIGIPAKIADGFFLIALNDGKAEEEANMTLLRRQSWIDVPVVYKSGRRALFTMEKGIPGQKAFEDAIRAWQAATTAEGEGNG